MRRNRPIALASIWLLCVCTLCVAGQTPERGAGVRQQEARVGEKRLALVIGNGAYQYTASLANPVNDAADISSALKELGFEVIFGANQTLPQMRRLMREFGTKLRQNGGVGLFYYAGHGIQAGGRNFIIPVEADIASEVETEDVALDVNSVLQQMDAANNGFNIVILDACRNNPFARSWNRDIASGGLAQINAPNGTLIEYATCPNCVASDGRGRNGLYTEVLLNHIKRADVDLMRMFQNVRAEVKKRSNGTQVPWESNSTTGDFYFFSTQTNKASSSSSAANPAPTSGAAPYVTPSNLDAPQYFAISQAYINRGDLDRALVEINKALEISPAYGQAYVLRAGIYHLKNQHDKVIADCGKAIELKVDNEFPYVVRGSSYNVIGKHELAFADFSKAIQINPQSGLAYIGRGTYHANKKMYERAISDYTQGMKLGSVDAQNYYNRGTVYAHTNDYNRAVEDFSKAIELNPRLGVAYLNRATIYEKMGHAERAAADKKKYLEIMGIP